MKFGEMTVFNAVSAVQKIKNHQAAMNALYTLFFVYDVVALVTSIIFGSLNSSGNRTRYLKYCSLLVHWIKCLTKIIYSFFATATDFLNLRMENKHKRKKVNPSNKVNPSKKPVFVQPVKTY